MTYAPVAPIAGAPLGRDDRLREFDTFLSGLAHGVARVADFDEAAYRAALEAETAD